MGASLANELIWDARPGATRAEYFDAAIEALEQAFPCDSIGWNNLNWSAGMGEVIGRPVEVFGPHTPEAVETMMHVGDHPMITSYISRPGETSPRRMSDIVSLSELHHTDAYHELLHPFESEFQFTILTAADKSLNASCWTFNRRMRDFSDDDIELAKRIQPLLVLIERTWAVNDAPDLAETDLTPREASVLSLLAQGLTARAMGARLGISPSTVNKHLEHIYKKLNTGDRLLAVEKARSLGIISVTVARRGGI